MKANADIREKAKQAGVYLWQVAEPYGVSEYTFIRKLRQELHQDEKQKIFEIIDRLAREKQGAM